MAVQHRASERRHRNEDEVGEGDPQHRRDGVDLAVEVEGPLSMNDQSLMVEAARTQALVTPKQFGDATMLPANHIEWTRSCRRPRLRLRSSMSACAC